jgi:hypothetical protein
MERLVKMDLDLKIGIYLKMRGYESWKKKRELGKGNQ